MPGMIGSHSSAWSAVPVRRGSMTTTLPPRARMRVDLADDVGAREQRALRRLRVARPCTTRQVGALDVGDRDLPHAAVHQDATLTFFGHWSTVPDE